MAAQGNDSTPEAVFSGSQRGLALFQAVERLLHTHPGRAAQSTPQDPSPDNPQDPATQPGPVHTRATTSEVVFRARRGFAYMWWPGRYVRSEVPAVLSIALHEHLASPRFKSVVQVSPALWMHHLELNSEADLDAEVAGWLLRAREEAG